MNKTKEKVYSDRLRVLNKAYLNLSRDNEKYTTTCRTVETLQAKKVYLDGLTENLKMLEERISASEKQWRRGVLSVLEGEIAEALTYIYPTDGYTVSLDVNILYGKLHIKANVSGFYLEGIAGKINGTQGRLFQQTVSIATLVGIMTLLGTQTLYIDEAFSGVATGNIPQVNKIIDHYRERGFNIILIAQDQSMGSGIEANVLLLERSLDNKTSISQYRR